MGSSSFGAADDGDSGAGGGPFHFSKKRAEHGRETKYNRLTVAEVSEAAYAYI